MPIPSSNIGLSHIQTEFGGAAPISMSEYFRGGVNVPAGQAVSNIDGVQVSASGGIRMGMFRNLSKAFVFNRTISVNTSNYNLRQDAINNGWNQSIPLFANVTIAGVTVSASVTWLFAFDRQGSFPAGSTLSIVNNGNIIGMGGAGGAASGGTGFITYEGTAGGGGGPALSPGLACSITNNGIIGGGGGGGGGARSRVFYDGKKSQVITRGGGGGGGRTGATNTSGGARGGAGSWSPIFSGQFSAVDGATGTFSGGGAGGRGDGINSANDGGVGGAGGGWGAAGGSGSAGTGFGGYASAGGPYGGGAGGAAVSGNSNITWLATGTLLGAING